MRRVRSSSLVSAFASLCAACSSSPPPAEAGAPPPDVSPPSAGPALGPEAPAVAAPAPAPAPPLPTACAPGAEKGLCVPEASFVERLCSGEYPDVALAMLAKGTPWTRGYVSRNVETWDATSRSRARLRLDFDEEVLVLAKRAAPEGGIQVSGATGTWRALRWDGRCVALEGNELGLRPPPRAKAASIAWKYLDEGTKGALLEVDRIRSIYEIRQKECKSSDGEPTKRCEQLETKLSGAVVDFLRGGGKIPEPPRRP
jgi:hypothetical protein